MEWPLDEIGPGESLGLETGPLCLLVLYNVENEEGLLAYYTNYV